MNILTVTLKQHTPLLHFQHEQEGATLRASEVKPMLDKFIIENQFNNEKEKYKDFVIKSNTNEIAALNYKLKIKGIGEEKVKLDSYTSEKDGKTIYETKTFPLVLSNMGGKEEKESLVNFSFYKEIELTFLYLNEDLGGYIEYWIDLFFAERNFGQRKDKGFGSFSVISINGEKKDLPIDDIRHISQLQFRTNYRNNKDLFETIFNVIDFYWKCLKSGINYTMNKKFPDRYIKSFLWIYLNNKEQTWEKKFIKEKFNLTTGEERKENPNPPSFARALLGMPDKFEYINKNKTVNVISNTQIERIPSPYIFKPIVNGNKVDIYIFTNIGIKKQLQNTDKVNRSIDFKVEVKKGVFQTEELTIEPDIINYKELISKYNDHLFENVNGIVLNNISEDVYLSQNGIKIKDDEKWFVPKDFKWRNIVNIVKIIK